MIVPWLSRDIDTSVNAHYFQTFVSPAEVSALHAECGLSDATLIEASLFIGFAIGQC